MKKIYADQSTYRDFWFTRSNASGKNNKNIFMRVYSVLEFSFGE